MKIEILGTGCPKCKKLEENTRKAVQELDLDAEILKVTDIKKIMNYKVMMIPALIVDGKVVLSGKILSSDGLKSILKQR